jgi:hypothetical protein
MKKTNEFKRAFKRWIDHTTLHGITYIYDSSSIFFKFIWTVVFFGFFTFACWLLSKSFITFFDYNTDTSVSRIKVNEITFPAVTFCNLYYSTDINEKNYSAEIINQIYNINSPLYLKQQIVAYNALLFSFDKTAGKSYRSFFGKEKVGFDWSEMVMGCYFMSSECNVTYKEITSLKYGRCYTSKDFGQICNIE